jgi:hypothetical protein
MVQAGLARWDLSGESIKRSAWVWASISPGETIMPLASMVRRAPIGALGPT